VNIESVARSASFVPADAIAVGAGSLDDLSAYDAAFGGRLRPVLEDRKFKGAAGSVEVLPTFGNLPAKHLVVFGIGDRGATALLDAFGAVGSAARNLGVAHLAIDVPEAPTARFVEAIAAGNYRYDVYKKESARKAAVERISWIGDFPNTEALVDRATVRARAQSWARDLVNGPPAEVFPASLADAAMTLGALPHVTVEVWDVDRCRREGLVGIVAVGQGSANPPCLIHVTYRPPAAKQHVALVGKGVTFDSGGLSLKPSASMQTMRCDMAGAATTLAATKIAAELGLPIALDTFVGAVENMNDGNSYKLGDVLRYRNGVTAEIHNTDAEGRLVLADCLILASEVPGVTSIVDAATLTGAIVVALGPDYTGLFTADDSLATELLAASAAEAEGMWRMPLHRPYDKKIEATWGQIKNVGGPDGGSITAALFLRNFVADGKRWAHLDIAGSAFSEAANRHYAPGASGEMVRSLATWLENLAG
jgi:leucyl aminopeptidase